MTSAEFTEVIKPAYFWDGFNWVKINDPLSTYDNIVSASAAAYSSASAYTDSASASIVNYIDNLTTTDIEEGSNLYFTEERSLNTASTALVHNEHENITASFENDRIVLSGTSGGSVILSEEQPDVTSLEPGTIWVDSDAEITGGVSSGGGGAGLSFWTEDENGNLIPNTIEQNIGSEEYPVKEIYVSGSTLYIGNTNLSIDESGELLIGLSKVITEDNANDNLDLNNYLTLSTASTTYATKSELEEIDLTDTINTASAAAFASASAYTDQQISTIDLSSTIQTASAAAVSYLVDGAPETLDTLNELAAALDDNANILDLYLTQSSASSTYAKKIIRWRKTYSFSGNESFTVTNSGAGAYVVDGVSNPTFNLVKGNTYTFVINASGHPFWIQTVSGGYSSGDVYSTGTTNLGTDNGTITWVIPTDAPDTLYYACQFHSSMQGTINLIDPAIISGVDSNSNTLLYTPGQELLYINGVLLATNEYTTTSSSLITLNEGLSTDDVVDIVIHG